MRAAARVFTGDSDINVLLAYHTHMPLNNIEQNICDLISARSDQLLEELADHVAIPTGQNFTQGLDKYRDILINRLSALGATIEYMPGEARPGWIEQPTANSNSSKTNQVIPQVVIAKNSSGNGPNILIVGHIDTVHDPHGLFQTLSIDNKKEFCVGPGCVDMKGGVLIAITALEILAKAGINFNWTFLLNSDEEMGSFHSEKTLRDTAIQHDIGIVVEPALADGSLAVERMGSGQFKIEVFGQSAHVGRAFSDGESAVYKLANIISTLGKLADPDNGMIVNVGPLKGGEATNVVPDYAACWGNVRFANIEKGKELAQAIDALGTDENAMPRVVVNRNWNRPAKPLTDAVKLFAQAAAEAANDLGQTLPQASTGGVCDGNILQSVGLPTLDTLGVRGGNLHRPDEFVEIASLVERCQLLAVLLARIADGSVRIPFTK